MVSPRFFPPFQFVASLGKIFTMVAAGKSAKNVARESYSHKTNICEKNSNLLIFSLFWVN